MESPLVHTFSESGAVGQLIMVTLFGLSILTWGVIAKKIKDGQDRKKHTQQFLKLFHHKSGNLFAIHSSLKLTSPMAHIFKAGMDRLSQFVGGNEEPSLLLDSDQDASVMVAERKRVDIALSQKEVLLIEETLERKITDQLMKLDQFNVVLAITAAAGPLLGLLGTVWGIMESFRSMSTAGNASIAVVAPGISSALVTTVAGLIVAIPALIAFNLITSEVKKQAVSMENFASEFLSLIKHRYLVK